MITFTSFDVAAEKSALLSQSHEISTPNQFDLQILTSSQATTNNEHSCPDPGQCPDCHECHFGHCGIILENRLILSTETLESGANIKDQVLMSREFYSIFRPPIKA